jgi:DHA1 family multidrug resistance protein-like MFS transporter
MTSRVFAYNQSFASIGNVIGPLIGAFVANLFGYRAIFLSGALFIALNFWHFLSTTKNLRQKEKSTEH